MAVPRETGIEGCAAVPVAANRDDRGCLFEIYRQSWPGGFATVQWNVCSSRAGVVRGVHVHVDYDEFYTLPQGRVRIGLVDIRPHSPSFGQSIAFVWSDRDNAAITVPKGVGHVVHFIDDAILAFGLSGYWSRETDVIGCRWNDPELGFDWAIDAPVQSDRDRNSGSFRQMLADYQAMARSLAEAADA